MVFRTNPGPFHDVTPSTGIEEWTVIRQVSLRFKVAPDWATKTLKAKCIKPSKARTRGVFAALWSAEGPRDHPGEDPYSVGNSDRVNRYTRVVVFPWMGSGSGDCKGRKNSSGFRRMGKLTRPLLRGGGIRQTDTPIGECVSPYRGRACSGRRGCPGWHRRAFSSRACCRRVFRRS